MTGEVVIVWSYRVRPDAVDAFERDYGSDGAWAQLFRRHDGYLGTELRGVDAEPYAYMTFDRWASCEARDAFMRAHGDAYAALDMRCAAYTTDEALVGEFGADAPASAR